MNSFDVFVIKGFTVLKNKKIKICFRKVFLRLNTEVSKDLQCNKIYSVTRRRLLDTS